MLACRDRLNYWRTLQELAGIHNRYIELAIEKVREEEQLADAAQRQQLQEEHNEELETVRSETASDVMGQLVDVLMGGDLASLIQGGGPAVSMPASDASSGAEPAVETENNLAEPAPEVPVDEEEEVRFDDPWIDTMMCTTCDDCMAINKLVFVYNDDKQAIIADAKAGTFAELVQAAEICPAKCIHPGNPLNPDEPGLDELIARAEPFN
jgi:ferredoxin